MPISACCAALSSRATYMAALASGSLRVRAERRPRPGGRQQRHTRVRGEGWRVLYQSARSLARIHQHRGNDDPIHYSREKIPAAARPCAVGNLGSASRSSTPGIPERRFLPLHHGFPTYGCIAPLNGANSRRLQPREQAGNAGGFPTHTRIALLLLRTCCAGRCRSACVGSRSSASAPRDRQGVEGASPLR
jgi:hypothetical protein